MVTRRSCRYYIYATRCRWYGITGGITTKLYCDGGGSRWAAGEGGPSDKIAPEQERTLYTVAISLFEVRGAVQNLLFSSSSSSYILPYPFFSFLHLIRFFVFYPLENLFSFLLLFLFCLSSFALLSSSPSVFLSFSIFLSRFSGLAREKINTRRV